MRKTIHILPAAFFVLLLIVIIMPSLTITACADTVAFDWESAIDLGDTVTETQNVSGTDVTVTVSATNASGVEPVSIYNVGQYG